jgi:hypothetical protein
MEVNTPAPKVNSSARQSCRLRLNQARPTQPCPEYSMRDPLLPPAVASFIDDERGSVFYEVVLVASLTVVVGIIVLLALGKGR